MVAEEGIKRFVEEAHATGNWKDITYEYDGDRDKWKFEMTWYLEESGQPFYMWFEAGHGWDEKTVTQECWERVEQTFYFLP